MTAGVTTTATMKQISLLLLSLGITTVLGSSTTILQNLIRGSALKCLADLGGGLREWRQKNMVFAAVCYSADTRTGTLVASQEYVEACLHYYSRFIVFLLTY